MFERQILLFVTVLAVTVTGWAPSAWVPDRSALATSWYGIRQVPVSDLPVVADSLGGEVVSLGIGTLGPSEALERLDRVYDYGYRAVVSMYVPNGCSMSPWEWNGSEWVFPQETIDTLQAIAHHPAMFAIYALQEPFDETNPCHWTVEQQQQLYQRLKLYTDGLPVWSDIGGVAILESEGIHWAGGICDYCSTFHHSFRSDWTSAQCLQETLSWIDADREAQPRLMPDSVLVFQIQTYAQPDYPYYPLRLPTQGELETVRDHLCTLHQPMMYYPWSHGLYSQTLDDAPALWPIIAEGCAPSGPLPYAVFLPAVLRNHPR